ncbi:AraC family transcriptional regulator [Paenalcaligenes sp. Me131]|uniref:AraC family transcriptional regulator n=1 Tax=Paenalcaligenes sp. Me131 TaxID=3392636 RepID=UPI003D2C78FB
MTRAMVRAAERNTQPNQGQNFWHDPALPFVETRRACHSRACYKPHAHPTFSIGAVDGGTSVFAGAEGGPVALRPGSLVFVPAERVHACNPAPDSAWSYQMLHLDVAWLRMVREEYANEPSQKLEPVRVVSDAVLYVQFCTLNDVLFSAAPTDEKEAALIEFVGDYDVSQSVWVEPISDTSVVAKKIQPALEYLRNVPTTKVSLVELASLTNMSRYQLIRAFRTVTGMTPHIWQLNLRINVARSLMHQGDSLAEVAHHLGFADQAHFQRVFKAYTGVTPGSYKG